MHSLLYNNIIIKKKIIYPYIIHKKYKKLKKSTDLFILSFTDPGGTSRSQTDVAGPSQQPQQNTG